MKGFFGQNPELFAHSLPSLAISGLQANFGLFDEMGTQLLILSKAAMKLLTWIL